LTHEKWAEGELESSTKEGTGERIRSTIQNLRVLPVPEETLEKGVAEREKILFVGDSGKISLRSGNGAQGGKGAYRRRK